MSPINLGRWGLAVLLGLALLGCSPRQELPSDDSSSEARYAPAVAYPEKGLSAAPEIAESDAEQPEAPRRSRVAVSFSLEMDKGVRYLVFVESLIPGDEQGPLRIRAIQRDPDGVSMIPHGFVGSPALQLFSYPPSTVPSECNRVKAKDFGPCHYQTTWHLETDDGEAFLAVSPLYEFTIAGDELSVKLVEEGAIPPVPHLPGRASPEFPPWSE